MINIWLNNHECHQIETDYNGARLSRDLGQFKLARKLAAQYHTSYLRKVTETTINSGFNIFSIENYKNSKNIVTMISNKRVHVETKFRFERHSNLIFVYYGLILYLLTCFFDE